MKMQPALGDSSGCVRFLNASDSRAVARSRSGSAPGVTRNAAHSTISPVRFKPAVVVAELHPVGRRLQQRAVRPASRTLSTRSPMFICFQWALP